MIHVDPQPEPDGFDETVRQPGLRALAEMVGERSPVPRKAGRSYKKIAHTRNQIPSDRLPAYWTNCLDQLMTAYQKICAYSCFRIHPVTGSRSVDHLAPRSRAWDRVYEWTNYRLACSLMNARKREFGDVLDPFEVQDGWFVLELVGFQVRPAPGLDAATRQQVQFSIDRLGLNEFRAARERDAENYWSGRVTLAILTEESPFVARELRRQGRLLEGDV